jgi:hypothetical protein
MTYLRRLVQRLMAETPPNMLLPNGNGWGGVFDPFENTQYLPPVFPVSNKKPNAGRAEIDSPVSAPQGSETTPLKEPRLDEKAGTTSGAEPAGLLEPKKFADVIAQQENPPQAPSFSAVNREAPVVSGPIAQPVQNAKTGGVPEKHHDLLPRQQPQAAQIKTRWVRRYLSDAETPGNISKPKAGRHDDTGQSRWLPPRCGFLPLKNENAPAAFVKPGSSPVNRRALKRKETQGPRLIIGQLTVDVVPEKAGRSAKSRKRPLRNRNQERPDKFTQAETARFGFGIGQM